MKTESLKSLITDCRRMLEDYLRLFFEPRELKDRLILTSLGWDGTTRELSMNGVLEHSLLTVEAVFVAEEKVGVKRLEICMDHSIEIVKTSV